MHACRPTDESRKSINANSDRRKPSSTKRALASLGVHPYRFAIRFRRFPLATGRRMLITVEPTAPPCNFCKYCNSQACKGQDRRVPHLRKLRDQTWDLRPEVFGLDFFGGFGDDRC